MSEQKTHYRKVYKSDHLGSADLEDLIEAGSNLIFTIECVRQEMNAKVAGKKMNANIAYFREDIKPLVLNSTNAGVIRKLTGSGYIENWADTAIQLYVDKNVKMMGEVVGGVRIRPTAPRIQKPVITPANQKQWANAKNALVRDGNLSAVLQRADMSPEHQQQMIQELANV